MDKLPPRGYMRLQWRLHRLVWNLTRGRLGRTVTGMPVLELVTTGHRSGDPRSILITYVDTPSGPALAGTNAGSNRDPAWVTNLRVRPDAKLREGGQWREIRARFIDGDEWEAVWQQFLEHPGYGDYQKILTRPIPIVVLE